MPALKVYMTWSPTEEKYSSYVSLYFMCPLTGSAGLLQAQVITVETRINIFWAEKVSI